MHHSQTHGNRFKKNKIWLLGTLCFRRHSQSQKKIVESGKILRISDKGITRFSGRGRGDMYVQLNIKTPDRITRQQKELLEKLKKEGL